MHLNDKTVRSAAPKRKPYKMGDGEGLHLLVHPNGGKYWQLRYRFAGKERKLSIGKYPEVTLAEARNARFNARKAIREGIDPGAAKQQDKLLAVYRGENSFRVVAEEWRERNSPKWSAQHYRKTWGRLENHVLPHLGRRPVAEITSIEVLAVIQRIEDKNLTAMSRRVLQLCSSIFRYAKVTGRVVHNPASDLTDGLRPHIVEHYPTLKADELPQFLEAFKNTRIQRKNRIAFLLLLHTAVRTKELRYARWEDIDFKRGEWRIPGEFMKMRREHLVPLSEQVEELFRELRMFTGDNPWCFPNRLRRNNPVISDAIILRVIERMGYRGRMVGHGFRSLFSTVLNERGFNCDAIERQLAHTERNAVRAAYNRAEYLEERREMMQWWSDHLERVGKGRKDEPETTTPRLSGHEVNAELAGWRWMRSPTLH